LIEKGRAGMNCLGGSGGLRGLPGREPGRGLDNTCDKIWAKTVRKDKFVKTKEADVAYQHLRPEV